MSKHLDLGTGTMPDDGDSPDPDPASLPAKDELLGFVLDGSVKPQDVPGWGSIRAGHIVAELLAIVRSSRDRIKCRDDYIKFLFEVESSRSGIVLSHPHFGHRPEDIKRGYELRAAIAKADAALPTANRRGEAP